MEKELKYALSRRSYEKLALLCDPSRGKTQANTYFDDAHFSLRRKKAGLRIRIENGKRAFFTLKASISRTEAGAKEGWHERQEWENPLALSAALGVVAGKRKLSSLRSPLLKTLNKNFPDIPLASLKRLGTLETWRMPLAVDRFSGELDCWKVHGRTFYELEIETSSRTQCEAAVKKLFKDLHIPFKPRSTTKLAALFRFRRQSKVRTKK